jgi:hypothetical protein
MGGALQWPVIFTWHIAVASSSSVVCYYGKPHICYITMTMLPLEQQDNYEDPNLRSVH